MPNRVIKESAFTSERIAELSDFEFRLWIGLITQADDAGRGDARPAIIKGRCFALRERVSVKDIDAALHALAATGCVSLYKVDGKPYFWFPSWAEHQRIRDAKPKYPSPDDADPPEMTNGGELRRVAASCGLNPIQSNPNPNPNPIQSETHDVRTDGFEQFWAAYPKKVGKEAARKAWIKAKGVSLDVILGALEAQKRSDQWHRDNGRYIPNPANWLKHRLWQDELPAAARQDPAGPGRRELGDDELEAIRQLMEG